MQCEFGRNVRILPLRLSARRSPTNAKPPAASSRLIGAKPRLRLAPVSDGGGQRRLRTIAPDFHANLPAGLQAADQVDEMILVADRDVVDLQYDVIGLQAGG